MGYGEYGFQGGTDVPTPHIDSIARNGVRFAAGYVSDILPTVPHLTGRNTRKPHETLYGRFGEQSARRHR